MQYTCANCEHVFESNDKKPRCPQCLRRHGLISDDAPAAAGKGGAGKGGAATGGAAGGAAAPSSAGLFWAERGRLVVLGVLFVVVTAGVILFLVSRRKKVDNGPRNVGMGPVSAAKLKAVARRRGSRLEVVHFAPDAAILAYGKTLRNIQDGGVVAEKLLAPIRRAIGIGPAPKGFLKVRAPGRVKRGPVLTAAQLFGALQKKEPLTVTSYELASLYLAEARAAGLHAVMAEIYGHKDLKGPADPAGFVGAFGVAIYRDNTFKDRPLVVVDPARGKLNATREFEVLTDLRAAAEGLGHQALNLLETDNNAREAVQTMDAALRLAPQSATLLAARGMLLLKSGGIEPALDAFRAARSLREDAPRYLCVAVGLLGKRDTARALNNIDLALGRDPNYALGYAMKAMILLTQARADEAAGQLDKAQELDPTLPEVLQTRAMLLLSADKKDQALALLRQVIAAEPFDDQARFQLWRVLFVTGDTEAAAKAAKEWLAVVPSARRPMMRQQIEAFKEGYKKYKAQQAPTMPSSPGGGDPYKLKMPGGTTPGDPGTTPFGKPPGNDSMLQL